MKTESVVDKGALVSRWHPGRVADRARSPPYPACPVRGAANADLRSRWRSRRTVHACTRRRALDVDNERGRIVDDGKRTVANYSRRALVIPGAGDAYRAARAFLLESATTGAGSRSRCACSSRYASTASSCRRLVKVEVHRELEGRADRAAR